MSDTLHEDLWTFFKLWHPRYVLITVYKEWYQVVKTQLFKFISYMMEVASNYMYNLMMATTKAETCSF